MSLLKNRRIIFLTPYPHDTAPGQRFRFEQYYSLLNDKDYEVKALPFLSHAAFAKLYQKNNGLTNLISIAWGFLKRIFNLTFVVGADFVFVFREATPVGPPIFEWIIARVFRKKVIYDFDDAIWLTDRITESKIEKFSRWRSKVALICGWSYRISCGNAYLSRFAKQFNSNVIVNPTTIDTIKMHNQTKQTNALPNAIVTIGWTGSHSTLKYLKDIEPLLHKLEIKFAQVRFLVIADKKPQLNLAGLEFVKWNKENEVADLLKIDIGIMPLPDDDWTKGKCGFKALQYMALAIPAVASPVGANTEIIDHGTNGFLCHTEEDWLQCLEKLITDATLRRLMGIEGRNKVISNYSVTSNTSNFLGLFS
jgi:glycosyltransferase involved in cell wall biosynthesis